MSIYNEAHRVEAAIDRFFLWAERVVVFNKASTDCSRELALSRGATVVDIPYSLSGEGDPKPELLMLSNCETDWFIWLTPSEQLSLGLLRTINEVLQSGVSSTDVFAVPVKLYSFGEHVNRPQGPWSISYQPRIVNRHIGLVSDQIHQHFCYTKKSVRIPFNTNCYILHCTHTSFKSFVRSHSEYAETIAMQSRNNEQKLSEVLNDAHKFDQMFDEEGFTSLKYKLAWRIYHYMIALNLLISDEPIIQTVYAQLLHDLNKQIQEGNRSA